MSGPDHRHAPRRFPFAPLGALLRLTQLHPARVCVDLPGRWHLADAAVVIISLTLELTLKGVAQEVASLLVFFR